METIYTYYKNSNTGELVQAQEFAETKIKDIPVYFYDVHGKSMGENLSLDGFVEISEKKFKREARKLKS